MLRKGFKINQIYRLLSVFELLIIEFKNSPSGLSALMFLVLSALKGLTWT